jgi:hypothetical protein
VIDAQATGCLAGSELTVVGPVRTWISSS